MPFVAPSEAWEQRAKEYVAEFEQYGSDINGCAGLDRYLREQTYAKWLLYLAAQQDIAHVPPERAPSCTYFYTDDEESTIIGMIDIRLSLTDYLRREGGHIGYSVRPTMRRQGHATRMLREALTFCKPILGTVLITCDKENVASAGVIKNCGGVLESEVFSERSQETIQRYLIR